MSATVSDMRVAISRIYSSEKWKQKVKYMPDNQVIAIYYGFWERGKFDKKPVTANPVEYKQLSFDDILA